MYKKVPVLTDQETQIINILQMTFAKMTQSFE